MLNKRRIISILIPVTSRKMNYKKVDDIELFRIFIPSFLQSLSSADIEKFEYRFYIGYDNGDGFYDNEENINQIKSKFRQMVNLENVKIKDIKKCFGAEHKPVLVWNILAETAYHEQSDYFYQLGDDIMLISKRWSENFVGTLEKNNGLGVTGPLEVHNQKIITQSFVSRVHIDIFGYYFQSEIKNWYSDDWINQIYMPRYRFWQKKILVENMSVGSSDERYNVVKISKSQLKKYVKNGREKIKCWVRNSGDKNYPTSLKESLKDFFHSFFRNLFIL